MKSLSFKTIAFLILVAAFTGLPVEAHAFVWPFGKKKEVAQKQVVPASKRLSLMEAYHKALKRSESVKITAEEIAQAQARFYRSFDYFLPSVRYKISRYEQDVTTDSSGSSFDFSRRAQREQKFVFSQPLFSGFKEIAALTGSGADKKAQHLKWERAKQLLFMDVMDAYYTYLNMEKDAHVLYTIHQHMSQRIKDLRERVDVGRSRESELKNSMADIKILEADLVDSKRNVKTAKNLLAFYLGEDPVNYELTSANKEAADWIPDVTRSELRPDVLEAEQTYIVSQKKVISANAGLFPEITVDGNYYTRREGFQSGNDWDVRLTLDVPVFEVGSTLGDIKEASSNREKARLVWEEKKRMAFMEAKNALEEYNASQEAHEALHEAEKASRENYEILQKEFGQNLVNNLEVLDALRRSQDVQRRFNTAFFEAKKAYWRLCSALGAIPGIDTTKEKK